MNLPRNSHPFIFSLSSLQFLLKILFLFDEEFLQGSPPMFHTWVRVNAYSSGFAPRSSLQGEAHHFTLGQLVSGFVEKTCSGYQSAQFAGWDVLDMPWALHFRHEYLPQAQDFELTPKTIARLPLLGAQGFPFPKNPMISNSVRLEAPRLDISLWRQRTMAAGTARVSEFLRSGNHSLFGPIREEAEAHRSFSQAGSPRHSSNQRLNQRPPPVNNRHMHMRFLEAHGYDGTSRISLHDRESAANSERRPDRFNIGDSTCEPPLGAPVLFKFPMELLSDIHYGDNP